MLPDASRAYPVTLPDGTRQRGAAFHDRVIDHPGWKVGDCCHALDVAPPTNWAVHPAPCLLGAGRERLRIGRFCQSAQGVRFLTAGAGAVVRGRVPDYAIVTGNPAQVARMRLDADGHDRGPCRAGLPGPVSRTCRAGGPRFAARRYRGAAGVLSAHPHHRASCIRAAVPVWAATLSGTGHRAQTARAIRPVRV